MINYLTLTHKWSKTQIVSLPSQGFPRVPRLLTLLLSTFSGKRCIFTHFPLPGQQLSPLNCITMLLIPDYLRKVAHGYVAVARTDIVCNLVCIRLLVKGFNPSMMNIPMSRLDERMFKKRLIALTVLLAWPGRLKD